jgi:tRNA threonylcarbamoyladenosine biosynthesis protein TsaB
MIILSLETSGNVCGVALSNDNQVIAEYSVKGNNLHDKLCAELIRRIINDFDYKISDIDAIALSSGPGSFTGLRIGASIAKALCFKSDEDEIVPKMISVPTLSAFANNFLDIINLHEKNKILVAIKAQKDSLYYQTFDNNINQSEIILESTEIFEKIDFSDYYKIGPYFQTDENNIKYYNEYSAKSIAKLAIRLYNSNQFVQPESFTPLYIQEFRVKTHRKQLEI